jgi:cytochrome c
MKMADKMKMADAMKLANAGWMTVLALGLVSTAALADPAQGERVFQRCFSCHSVAAGEDKLPGPNLKTVVGRRAGTLPDFEYSPAMIAAGTKDNIVWTRENLVKYLADPDDMVPGTTMQQPLQLTPDERRDVVDYLDSAAKL